MLITLISGSPSLYLFDHNGLEIWHYPHYDSISSMKEDFTGLFVAQGIVDIIRIGKNLEVLAYFQHHDYYPTCIVRIDIITGEQKEKVLWHPGSIGGANLRDIDDDGVKEIVAGGASNGMNRALLFAIDCNKLNGTFPISANYIFQNIELADFDFNILFPKIDYAEQFFPKYNAVLGKPSIINDQISVTIYEGKANLFEADYLLQCKN